MSETIECEVLRILAEMNMTPWDIMYVSYLISDKTQQMHRYYCTFNDFLRCTKGKHHHDLKWPFDVCIVGDGWWISCDYNGEWIAQMMPKKPEVYKVPNVNDMLKNDVKNEMIKIYKDLVSL